MRLLDGGIVAVGELRDLQDWPRWGIESDRSGKEPLAEADRSYQVDPTPARGLP